MTLKLSHVVRLLILALAVPVICAGQSSNQSVSAKDEPDFIVPSRPTVSNPAEFQRPGVLQLEFGFNSNFHRPGGSSQEDLPLALRFAASRRILLELDLDSPLSQKVMGVRATGAGDTQLGIQVVLQHEKETRPGIAVAYYIKLPSASETKNLGTGRIDHNLIGFISKKIGGTTVDFNAVYLLAGRTTGSGHASSGQGALAASRGVTPRWGLQGEISGFNRNDAQPGGMVTLGAVTYQVNRRLVLDGGVRAGLTHDAPRVGFFAGMTVGVADFHRHHQR
ncbi:MAG: transporter [Acidobacteriota bacterium]|nr:transporter [Acidobacteriota bacterium]